MQKDKEIRLRHMLDAAGEHHGQEIEAPEEDVITVLAQPNVLMEKSDSPDQ